MDLESLNRLREEYAARTYPIRMFSGSQFWQQLYDRGERPPDLVLIDHFDDSTMELEVHGVWSGEPNIAVEHVSLTSLLNGADLYEYAVKLLSLNVR